MRLKSLFAGRHGPLLATLLLTAAAWLVMTWPLARYVSRGIPASSRATYEQPARHMIPGDHLQLLYRFWLFHDMCRGRTPWMRNVYEFNAGDDSRTIVPGSSYLPFSLVYAALAQLGGRALGWNLTGLLALWFTALFTWRLSERLCASRWVALPVALLSVIFPYRHEALLGGSPMGLAMMWVPMLLLGLDLAIRDGRFAGGVLAGIALLFAAWTDTQLFFFTALFTPAFVVLLLVLREDDGGPARWGRLFRMAWAGLPAALLGLLAVCLSFASKSELTGAVRMAEGRSIQEILLFSPFPADFFAPALSVVKTQVYIGFAPMAIATLSLLLVAFASGGGQRVPVRAVAALALLALLTTGVIVLAMGPRGPAGGAAYLAATDLIPPYAMVRQPAKIFCLMPTLLAAGLSLSFTLLRSLGLRMLPAWAVLAALILVGEYRWHIKAEICLLDREQPAYAAVAGAARAEGSDPRLLALPLWPGDSHWSSLYEHYASLYRIRMVNGYRPVVRRDYYDDVFMRLRSFNAGVLRDDQLDWLLARGIRYLALHEDAFPETVSPYPVACTMRALLAHPRLEPVAQGTSVRAFRILAAPATGAAAAPPAWDTFFPARYFEAENAELTDAAAIDDMSCSGGGFANLARAGAAFRTRSRGFAPAPDARWLIRARGHALLRVAMNDRDGRPIGAADVRVEGSDWSWQENALPALGDYTTASLAVSVARGAADVDRVLLAAGAWEPIPRGGSLILPAPLFFHAGYTREDNTAVVIRRLHDPADRIFYGPRLPLEPGVYTATLDVDTAAPRGTPLGTWRFEAAGTSPESAVAVTAAEPATVTFSVAENLPAVLSFSYDGTTDLELRGAQIRRAE